MIIRRKKVDKVSIEWANSSHKSKIDFYREQIKKVDEDPDKKERKAEQECVMCFKSGRVGGSACSKAQCAFCDTLVHSSNTNVDVCCIDCARVSNLCKHCGGDIDLKNRRKREFKERTPDLNDLK